MTDLHKPEYTWIKGNFQIPTSFPGDGANMVALAKASILSFFYVYIIIIHNSSSYI